jgi:hypothetical protein
MRGSLALSVVLAACGGGSSAPPKQPEPQPLQRTRIPIEEPDDDVPEEGVQIQSTRGHMDRAAIDAWLEPNSAGLSDCYTSRVGKRKWLGGHVSLHWEINKAGELTSVRLAESDLGAWPVEKCLLDLARAGSFGKPKGGDADFSIPLDFSAKGSLLSWDEDQALRAVGGQLASLDECAFPDTAGKKGKAVKKKPNGKRVTLPDDVVITLYVGPGGKAQSVGFSSSKAPIDDTWADCAEKLAMTWRLTDPRGVIAKLAVRYRAN